jgi:homoserine O-acetyltransferase
MVAANDIGLVTPFVEQFNEPLTLSDGSVLPAFELVVETYGELNAAKTNAVLICHALSGNHHAAGRHHADDRKPGWWDQLIGPGKPIDTSRFFVVCLNNLGGCDGSTGPASINPATQQAWGPDFPSVKVCDWVVTQALLADRLGIDTWAAVIGGSLGGMQALQWSIDLPDRVRHCVALAAAPRLTAQNIAFNEIARHAITSDKQWHAGHYQRANAAPIDGIALARMVGHLTYMSADGMSDKFGRELRDASIDGANEDNTVFEVESYLRYQGTRFATRFDANTYLLMTRALDHFDLAENTGGDLAAAMAKSQCRFLIMSFSSDWRFSPARSREITNALLTADKAVTYADIETDAGHDAFLIYDPVYVGLFDAWMRQVKI